MLAAEHPPPPIRASALYSSRKRSFSPSVGLVGAEPMSECFRRRSKWHASCRPGEIVGAVEGDQLREPCARTIDPALDRPCRDLADRGRLLVGEADAPTRSSASRWFEGSLGSVTRTS